MSMKITIREYLDTQGRSPYGRWFAGVNAEAAAKIARALYRMEAGNFSSVKGVGGGVFEFRIDFGPGYRVYFGKDGNSFVIMLGGGTKARQGADIARSRQLGVVKKLNEQSDRRFIPTGFVARRLHALGHARSSRLAIRATRQSSLFI